MAMQTKTIKQKMKSVANIGKITKAMEMISVSKMRKAIEKRNSSLPFAQESLQVLKDLSQHKNLSNVYLEKKEGKKILLVIVASNKGLCGGYNINVSKQVSQFIQEHKDFDIDAIAVGKQSQKIAVRNNIPLIASFDNFSHYYTAGEVHSLLQFIFEKYHEDEYSEVRVAYTEFFSSISYEAKVKPLIPLSLEHAEEIIASEEDEKQTNFVHYIFEPNEQEVLDTVVPAILLTILYQFLLEGLASEHSSRVSAMRNASDNAKELGEKLKINYNRARQAVITQEIAEIVGGSSAVS